MKKEDVVIFIGCALLVIKASQYTSAEFTFAQLENAGQTFGYYSMELIFVWLGFYLPYYGLKEKQQFNAKNYLIWITTPIICGVLMSLYL